MTAKTVGYWICTVLIALFFLYSGIGGLMHNPTVVAGMIHLGYPPDFVIILAVWKLLGAVAILLPGFALLKEWAYAGMIFDLSGAVASHTMAGDGVSFILTPLVPALVVIASWALRPENRRLKQA